MSEKYINFKVDFQRQWSCLTAKWESFAAAETSFPSRVFCVEKCWASVALLGISQSCKHLTLPSKIPNVFLDFECCRPQPPWGFHVTKMQVALYLRQASNMLPTLLEMTNHFLLFYLSIAFWKRLLIKHKEQNMRADEKLCKAQVLVFHKEPCFPLSSR